MTRTARKHAAAYALFLGATTEGEAAAAYAACRRIERNAPELAEDLDLDLDSAWHFRQNGGTLEQWLACSADDGELKQPAARWLYANARATRCAA